MTDILPVVIQTVKTVAVGLFVLGVLVLIHEAGHFVAAKLFGIRVLAFSLGMGKPLVSRRIGGTDYRLCVIPIGGYVQLAAEMPEDTPSDGDDKFSSKPIWQRALVAMAGPVANYVAAVACLWIVLLGGIDRPLYLERPVVGAVSHGSPAFKAGIMPGDSIVAINGRAVVTWLDVQKAFAFQNSRYTVELWRNAAKHSVTVYVPPVKDSLLPTEPLAGLLPAAPARIGVVMPGKPAETAGLSIGDSIVAVDGRPVHSWYEMSQFIARFDTSADSMRITVVRDGAHLTVSVRPRFEPNENRFMVGIGPTSAPSRHISMNAADAAVAAVKQTAEFIVATVAALKKIIMRDVSPRQLIGPVGIVQMSGSVAILEGLRSILNLMAFVGVNLAVINLLPLVVTDGGLLFFLLIEAIRRRPVSARVQLLASRIAWGFFIALFVFLTFNDLARIPILFRMFSGGK